MQQFLTHHLKALASLVVISAAAPALSGCKERPPKDPQQVEFEKKFEKEAVLVKTCPGDPRYASGPTAAAQRVYRYEKELWFEDITGPRKIEATPETVCDALTEPGGPKPSGGIILPGGIKLPGTKN